MNIFEGKKKMRKGGVANKVVESTATQESRPM
jgi:hypothetical protein